MQIIRRSSVAASPWKNGGGVTQELIRVPTGDAAFRWRMSIAQVDESGPFSDFAGYRRTMVLLRGAGVRLDIEGAAPEVLAAVGAMAEFDGARKTDCQLLDGPCTDLNLMVAHSLRGVVTRVELVGERRPVPAPPPEARDGILLIFSIVGGLAIKPDARPAVFLAPWDLAILPAGGRDVVAPDPPPDPERGSSSLVFFATLNDNSAPSPAG